MFSKKRCRRFVFTRIDLEENLSYCDKEMADSILSCHWLFNDFKSTFSVDFIFLLRYLLCYSEGGKICTLGTMIFYAFQFCKLFMFAFKICNIATLPDYVFELALEIE